MIIRGLLLPVVVAVSVAATGCGAPPGRNAAGPAAREEDLSKQITGTFVKGQDRIVFSADSTFEISGAAGTKRGSYTA